MCIRILVKFLQGTACFFVHMHTLNMIFSKLFIASKTVDITGVAGVMVSISKQIITTIHFILHRSLVLSIFNMQFYHY